MDNPWEDPGTLAPLSSTGAKERFTEQVKATVAEGATLLAGGEDYDGPGAWVRPVVLTDVKKGSRGYYEELFGPAFMVFKVSSEEEAIELANDTPFGLGSAIFSSDSARAEKVGSQIDSGMVYINTPEETREYLPFGGVKRSGIGRELGPLAMDEFANKQLFFKKNA